MSQTALLLSPAAHCKRRALSLSLWPIAINRIGHSAENRVSPLRRAEQHGAASCATFGVEVQGLLERRAAAAAAEPPSGKLGWDSVLIFFVSIRALMLCKMRHFASLERCFASRVHLRATTEAVSSRKQKKRV